MSLPPRIFGGGCQDKEYKTCRQTKLVCVSFLSRSVSALCVLPSCQKNQTNTALHDPAIGRLVYRWSNKAVFAGLTLSLSTIPFPPLNSMSRFLSVHSLFRNVQHIMAKTRAPALAAGATARRQLQVFNVPKHLHGSCGHRHYGTCSKLRKIKHTHQFRLGSKGWIDIFRQPS